MKDYVAYLNTKVSYIQNISPTTLYLRVPDFNLSQRKKIDSILQANDALITSTPNLIIDIRNNGGGADASYKKIIPYPSNVAIMINENNASTAEQFLLEAKQSKKVKLFGAILLVLWISLIWHLLCLPVKNLN
ncbi:S41 family peptidase [Pedobacter sp. NJ-S-72]